VDEGGSKLAKAVVLGIAIGLALLIAVAAWVIAM